MYVDDFPQKQRYRNRKFQLVDITFLCAVQVLINILASETLAVRTVRALEFAIRARNVPIQQLASSVGVPRSSFRVFTGSPLLVVRRRSHHRVPIRRALRRHPANEMIRNLQTAPAQDPAHRIRVNFIPHQIYPSSST